MINFQNWDPNIDAPNTVVLISGTPKRNSEFLGLPTRFWESLPDVDTLSEEKVHGELD